MKQTGQTDKMLKTVSRRSRRFLSVLLAVFLVTGSLTPVAATPAAKEAHLPESVSADSAQPARTLEDFDNGQKASEGDKDFADGQEVTEGEQAATEAQELAEAQEVTAEGHSGADMLEGIDISEEGIQNATVDDETFDSLLSLCDQDELAAEMAEADELSAEGAANLTTPETTADYVRKRLVQRKMLISFNIITGEKNYLKYLKDSVSLAFTERENGKSYEGDYLYWSMDRYYFKIKKISGGYQVAMLCMYHSTREQEDYVDQTVAALIPRLGLNNPSLSDQEKILSAYRYITQNVSYDFLNAAAEHPNERIYTAYGALHDGLAVCQGYALVMYRLMKEAGVGVRMIAGTGKKESHGWNIVRIGGLYYNVDSTWDAQIAAEGYPYAFFLQNMSDFADHTRFQKYATADFMAAYPMAEISYPYRQSMQESFLNLPAVSAPASFALSVSRKSNETVRLAWTPVAGAVRYDIYSADAQGSFFWLRSTAAANADIVISPPAYLTFRVIAVGRTGSGYRALAISSDQSLDAQTGYAKKKTRVRVGNATYKILTSGAASKTVMLVSWNKNVVSADIPATVTIDGITYKVTQIGAKALKGRKKLKNLYIGSNVTTIKAGAFNGCKKLKNVVIRGKKLKKVGKGAFSKTAVRTLTAPGSKKTGYKKLLVKAGMSKQAKTYKIQ